MSYQGTSLTDTALAAMMRMIAPDAESVVIALNRSGHVMSLHDSDLAQLGLTPEALAEPLFGTIWTGPQAQVALASLEAARSRAMIALADLDRLYVDAAVGGEELTRIAPVRESVVELVAQQDATIEALRTGTR